MAHWERFLHYPSISMKTIVFNGRVVGSAGSFVDPQFGKPGVLYWIGRGVWGQGLATRALRQFLREFPARPVYAHAARDNVASTRVLEKCGFTGIGFDRGFANARGEEIEEAVFKLDAHATDPDLGQG